MPIDYGAADKVWRRYAWSRDNGHNLFVIKADHCERYFSGDQWDIVDKTALRLVRRPALTINKIMPTMANVMGDQINNRAEISFRPRNGANPDTADALNKVFKEISDNNQLDWKRSDMFTDGIITSRGWLDIRLDFNKDMQGEVRYSNINPKNVIVDPDGDEYDPDSWSEVFITKWLTADDIAVLYNKEDADYLRGKDASVFQYGYDSMEVLRDRFGGQMNPAYSGGIDISSVHRSIRVVERQYRELDNQKHFVEKETGDMRPIPPEFTRDRIAWFVEKFGFGVHKKLVRRIKWIVIADNVVLHDDWSPYKHFTVVPYFPHFRYGNTIGLVENLTGPQELLNKVTSQELHVLNSVANSGWKIQAGALLNMTMEELEQRGAQTGLVLELDDIEHAAKIEPNNTPQGLDRMSFKAEESIKNISGVTDSDQGQDRADVSGKAIEAKKKSSSTNLVKPFDQLTRTDYFIARNTLDLIQEFYTEPRVVTIITDHTTGATASVGINQVDQTTGEIVNDLMLGEYEVVVTSVPHRETLEDSQFDQAVALRELNVAIPDHVLIDASRLNNKKDVIKEMAAQANSPAAQQQQKTAAEQAQADVKKTEGEAVVKHADATLKSAKTVETLAKAKELAHGPAGGDEGQTERNDAVAEHEAGLKEDMHEHKKKLDYVGLRLKAQDQDAKQRLAEKAQADEAATNRVAAAKSAAAGKVSFNQP